MGLRLAWNEVDPYGKQRTVMERSGI